MLIAESFADSRALFTRLQGRHIHSTSDRVAAWLFSPLLGVFLPFFLVRVLVKDRAAVSLVSVIVLGALALSGPWLAAQIVANAYSVLEITTDRMHNCTPVPGFSWVVEAGSVHSINVELANATWVLVIRTAEGKKRRVALQSTIRRQFADLYPEFLESPPQPLPQWVATVAVVSLSLAILAVAAGLWYMRSLP
jgi:hypothetical protein